MFTPKIICWIEEIVALYHLIHPFHHKCKESARACQKNPIFISDLHGVSCWRDVDRTCSMWARFLKLVAHSWRSTRYKILWVFHGGSCFNLGREKGNFFRDYSKVPRMSDRNSRCCWWGILETFHRAMNMWWKSLCMLRQNVRFEYNATFGSLQVTLFTGCCGETSRSPLTALGFNSCFLDPWSKVILFGGSLYGYSVIFLRPIKELQSY